MDLKTLKYAKTHEWISAEGKVGISDHAQKEITDVVFVELPAAGKAVQKGSEAGTIESVKAAFPIYAPVSGKIIAANQTVASDPGMVNQSPYEKGWLFQMEISAPAELASLMTPEQYEKFLTEAPHH
jgi:glycine cleavage system H protein